MTGITHRPISPRERKYGSGIAAAAIADFVHDQQHLAEGSTCPEGEGARCFHMVAAFDTVTNQPVTVITIGDGSGEQCPVAVLCNLEPIEAKGRFIPSAEFHTPGTPGRKVWEERVARHLRQSQSQ